MTDHLPPSKPSFLHPTHTNSPACFIDTGERGDRAALDSLPRGSRRGQDAIIPALVLIHLGILEDQRARAVSPARSTVLQCVVANCAAVRTIDSFWEPSDPMVVELRRPDQRPATREKEALQSPRPTGVLTHSKAA